MSRQLNSGDRYTLPSGTLARLTMMFQLHDTLASWREGDVCMFERIDLPHSMRETNWINLRTGQSTNWPSMQRFTLLEDPADG